MKIDVRTLEPFSSIQSEIDLSHLVEKAADLIALDHVYIKGTLKKEYDTVILHMNVSLDVVQKCAISLLPVTYPLSFDSEIIFSENIEIMDYILEEVIDLDEIIFAEILLEKEPYVYHEDADRDSFDEEDEGHSAFKDLKNIYKV